MFVIRSKSLNYEQNNSGKLDYFSARIVYEHYLLATPAASPRDRFTSDSNYTSVIIETESFVELNHIRRKSPRAASVLKKRQLSNSSVQRLRTIRAKYQDTDEIPYEEMGTAVVLIGIFFVLLVHFLNEWENNQGLHN